MRKFETKFNSHDDAAKWATENGWVLQSTESFEYGVWAVFHG